MSDSCSHSCEVHRAFKDGNEITEPPSMKDVAIVSNALLEETRGIRQLLEAQLVESRKRKVS